MLARNSVQELVELAWKILGTRVLLRESEDVFLMRQGALPSRSTDRRRHRRYEYRSHAILCRDGKYQAVYTKNLSRSGVMIIAAEQLFPCEEVRLLLPSGDWFSVAARRCRRVQQQCFECGTAILQIDRCSETTYDEIKQILKSTPMHRTLASARGSS
jgi:hypothetical protein